LRSPFRLESNWEVPNAASLNREGRRKGVVNDEVVAVLCGIWQPSYLYIPVTFSIVYNWQILGNLASCRNIHLEDGLQGLGLNGKDNPVSPYIGFSFV
jgi:hypothetical protein